MLCYDAWKTLWEKQFKFLHYVFVSSGASISPTCLPFNHLLCSSRNINSKFPVQSYHVVIQNLHLGHNCQSSCYSCWQISKHCLPVKYFEGRKKPCLTCFCGMVLCCHCVGSFCFQRGQHFSFGNSRSSSLGGLWGLRRQETLRHSTKFAWSEFHLFLCSPCVRNSTGHYLCLVRQGSFSLTSQKQQWYDAQNGGKIKVQSSAHARHYCISICPFPKPRCCSRHVEVLWRSQQFLVWRYASG